MYRFVGVVHDVSPIETFGDKGFCKRTVVVMDESGRFTEYIPFDLTRDACNLADGLKPGDQVEVVFSLRGRKYQKDASVPPKYFVNLEASKLSPLRAYSEASVNQYARQSTPQQSPDQYQHGPQQGRMVVDNGLPPARDDIPW